MNENNVNNNQHLNSNELKPRSWLLYLLIVIEIIILIILATKVVTDRENKENEKSSIFDNFNNFDFGSVQDKIDQSEIDSFNWTFEKNSGTEWGQNVCDLLDDIITNNKKNSDHIIRVIFESTNTTEPSEIKNLKKNFEDWTDYEVSLDYNEAGYVYQVTIER